MLPPFAALRLPSMACCGCDFSFFDSLPGWVYRAVDCRGVTFGLRERVRAELRSPESCLELRRGLAVDRSDVAQAHDSRSRQDGMCAVAYLVPPGLP